MRRRRAISLPCSAYSMRSTARRTKGATSCCEPPASDPARRPGSGRAYPQLSAVPPADPEFLRDHAGRATHPAGGNRRESPRRLSVGLVVRTGDQCLRALLDGGRIVALHAAGRPRLLRDDRDPGALDGGHVLVCRAAAVGGAERSVVACV